MSKRQKAKRENTVIMGHDESKCNGDDNNDDYNDGGLCLD